MLDARKCFPPRCLPSWHVAMFDPTTTSMFILRQILACAWCKNGYVVRGRMVSLVNLKMLGRDYFILPIFSQQVTNRYITDKLIPAILEVGRKTSCFQPRFHEKLTPTSAGWFFTRIPCRIQPLPLATWGYYHQGDLHTFSTGGRSWFVVRKKIRAQTVWENHRWIRQRCHKQIVYVFLQKRWWHWYLMLRLFQAMAKTVILHKLPFLHRFGCF